MKPTIWLTSDWHFGHSKLVEKGYRPANYEDLIEERLYQVLRPGDSVICLGDVSLYSTGAEWVRRILRTIRPAVHCCLVKGNHDSGSVSHYLKDGWDWVCDAMTMDWGGLWFAFTHEPWAEGRIDLNVHGHLHAGEHRPAAMDPRCVLISMELTDYRPVPLQTVAEMKVTPMWEKGRWGKWAEGGR